MKKKYPRGRKDQFTIYITIGNRSIKNVLRPFILSSSTSSFFCFVFPSSYVIRQRRFVRTIEIYRSEYNSYVIFIDRFIVPSILYR